MTAGGRASKALSETRILFGVWLALGVLALALAARGLSAPGLYYDEVIQAEAAREFLDAKGSPLRIPGASSTQVFGRWLPVFTQPYMGALKSQLLIPSFAVFGASGASLRATTLAWGLLALLSAMLLAHRLLGLGAALVAGALLAVDPSFLFVSRHDWGSFALALLCRCAGLYLFATGWSQRSQAERAASEARASGARSEPKASGVHSGRPQASEVHKASRRRAESRLLGAGLCFGLGVYNKIDFAVPLAAAALALCVVAPRAVAEALRTQARRLLPVAAGLLLGASPLLGELGTALLVTRGAMETPSDADLWREKLGALRCMLDGSYFDRLMRAGGSFERMFDVEGAAAGPFLVIYGLAIAWLAVRLALSARRGAWEPAPAFVLATAIFASLGILATPRATRVHHVLGAYPFPQYVVALAILGLAGPPRQRARRAAAAGVALLALGGGLWTSLRTFDTIQSSHGKGRWSDALDELAGELAAEPGAVAVSLDWGFRAQLHFLDRGLEILEPIWGIARRDTNAGPWSFQGDGRMRYLLWERDFAVFPVGPAFLETVSGIASSRVAIRRHVDHQGDPAFVSVRIAGPHRIVYRGPHAARPFEVILE